MQRTKIVATIGPASDKKEIMRSLLKSGCDVFRLNFSHGNYKEFSRIIKDIRSLEKEFAKPIAILQDLQGPKIRVGEIEGTIFLKKDQLVKIAETQEDAVTIPMAKSLIKNLREGNEVLITDGTIRLKVMKIKKDSAGTSVICRVLAPGAVTSHKGVNLPGVKIEARALTEKDKKDLRFGLGNGVDFVALSFVKKAGDLLAVRAIMEKRKTKTKLIAKIETLEAVENLDGIIDASDAVMVARGDLGIEISLEKISGVQKEIIKKCNAKAKPVITATQMLGSMVKNSVPTRAEVSDVANAVLDGTDAVMLSEETAIGDYPAETVRMMNKIIGEIEKSFPFGRLLPNKEEFAIADRVALSIGDGINQIVKDLDVKALIAFTESGGTGRIISAFRPAQPILTVSPYVEVLRQLSLSWGVVPIKAIALKTVDQMIHQAKDITLKSKIAKKGEKIIISAGIPFGRSGSTNLILVQAV